MPQPVVVKRLPSLLRSKRERVPRIVRGYAARARLPTCCQALSFISLRAAINRATRCRAVPFISFTFRDFPSLYYHTGLKIFLSESSITPTTCTAPSGMKLRFPYDFTV
jgi:hypothetical protein